jgi:hypothetical protein
MKYDGYISSYIYMQGLKQYSAVRSYVNVTDLEQQISRQRGPKECPKGQLTDPKLVGEHQTADMASRTDSDHSALDSTDILEQGIMSEELCSYLV